jgi:hypothetical protein
MRTSRVECLERIEFRLPSFVTSTPSTDKALAASLYSKSVLDTILDDIGISSVERFQSTGAGVGNISMIGRRGVFVVPEMVPSLVADRHRAPYSISMCRERYVQTLQECLPPPIPLATQHIHLKP